MAATATSRLHQKAMQKQREIIELRPPPKVWFCAICIDDINGPAYHTRCGHVFHVDCLHKYKEHLRESSNVQRAAQVARTSAAVYAVLEPQATTVHPPPPPPLAVPPLPPAITEEILTMQQGAMRLQALTNSPPTPPAEADSDSDGVSVSSIVWEPLASSLTQPPLPPQEPEQTLFQPIPLGALSSPPPPSAPELPMAWRGTIDPFPGVRTRSSAMPHQLHIGPNTVIDLNAVMPTIHQQLRRDNFVDLDQPLPERSTPPPERAYFNQVHEQTRILQRGDEQLGLKCPVCRTPLLRRKK
jgi:hypothetical protein